MSRLMVFGLIVGYVLAFVMGTGVGAATGAYAPRTVQVTARDASGRVWQGTGHVNAMNIRAGALISVDFTTDQLFCSAFGP